MYHSTNYSNVDKISELITSLPKYLEPFLDAQDIAQRSKTVYRDNLRLFFKWLAARQITHPTRETIIKFKEHLSLRGLSPNTCALYMVSVRRYFDWLHGEGLYENIAKNIRGARRMLSQHLKDSLSVEEIKLVLDKIPRHTLLGKRDFAMVNLIVRTGLRLIEVVNADYRDIEPQGTEALLWVRGKGRDGKDNYVVLTEESLRPLMEYIRLRDMQSVGEPLFPSMSTRNPNQRLTIYHVSRLIKDYFIKAEVKTPRKTAHSLRHSFGVLSIKSGASLHEVQLAMRHSNPGTTQVYLGDIERQMRREAGPEKRINFLLN